MPGQHALAYGEFLLPARSHAVGMDASVLLFLVIFSLGPFGPCWCAQGEHWLCATRHVVARAFGALSLSHRADRCCRGAPLRGHSLSCITDMDCKVLCFSWNIRHSCGT